MKNGIRTSEFWVMLVASIVTEANLQMNGDLDVTQIAMVWGPAAAYIVARGLAKLGGKN